MAVYNLFESYLSEDIIFENNTGVDFSVMSVEKLSETAKIKDGCIYITNELTVKNVIQKNKDVITDRQIIILVSSKGNRNVVIEDLAKHCRIAMIIAKESEADLSLCAARAMQYYLHISKCFDRISTCGDIVDILEIVHEYIGEEITFINSFGNALYTSINFPATVKKEVDSQFGAISAWSDSNNLTGKTKDQFQFYFFKVFQSNNLYGILFISRMNGQANDYGWIFKNILPNIARVINFVVQTDVKMPPKFSTIWRGIMDGKYSSNEEIRKRLTNMGLETDEFFRITIIQLSQPANKIENIYNQIYPIINRLFTKALVTLYLGYIIVLTWENTRYYYCPLDEEQKGQFEKLLDEYNGIACISWTNRDLMHAAPTYRLMQKSLNMHSQIKEKQNKSRIVPFSYSNPYLVIDMCAQHLRNTADMRDIVLLCHPAIINLYRYDSENNTNLEEVLFSYITNCKSLEKTAKDLYMHRNTVVNKMRKIKTLMDIDFEDPSLHAHLVFSHYILHYCADIIDPNYISKG